MVNKMGVSEDIETLKLFNEKAEKLANGGFTTQLKNNNWHLSAKIHDDRATGIQITDNFPDQTSIDAFVLNLRFFIQDNEKSPFRNLSKLYDGLIIPNLLKDRFRKERASLNDFLGKESSMNNGKKNISNRQILTIFVYGGIAHANRKKKAIFDRWIQHPWYKLAELEFCHILEDFSSNLAR